MVQDIRYYYIYDENPRLGFIVSRKYGNSVGRNLFKRRCRYIFYKLIKNGCSYSIIIKPKVKNIQWHTIKDSFESVHEKIAK